MDMTGRQQGGQISIVHVTIGHDTWTTWTHDMDKQDRTGGQVTVVMWTIGHLS